MVVVFVYTKYILYEFIYECDIFPLFIISLLMLKDICCVYEI